MIRIVTKRRPIIIIILNYSTDKNDQNDRNTNNTNNAKNDKNANENKIDKKGKEHASQVKSKSDKNESSYENDVCKVTHPGTLRGCWRSWNLVVVCRFRNQS